MKPAFLKNFTPGASKYSNKKCEMDGLMFDSKKEARVYSELKLLQAAGEILEIRRQVVFTLVPSQFETREKVDGKGRAKLVQVCVERPLTYIADFVITHPDGEITVIDVKGMRNQPVFVIKRKLMRFIHKIAIKEV